ncbi:MAG TPA: lasso RiPP family leader peptide-containing protein [Vicinamibacterales bacterium]|jgi:hypothetical protein
MEPRETPASGERTTQAPARKVYQKPSLEVYGDLAEITQGIAGSKTKDGSAHPNMHFTS